MKQKWHGNEAMGWKEEKSTQDGEKIWSLKMYGNICETIV